jgi:hypothetical protein
MNFVFWHVTRRTLDFRMSIIDFRQILRTEFAGLNLGGAENRRIENRVILLAQNLVGNTGLEPMTSTL